jgi:hypothetical protein
MAGNVETTHYIEAQRDSGTRAAMLNTQVNNGTAMKASSRTDRGRVRHAGVCSWGYVKYTEPEEPVVVCVNSPITRKTGLTISC